MNKTKIDFKNVLAGIGVGAIFVFLIVMALVRGVNDGSLKASLSGDDNVPPIKIVEDDLGGFSPDGSLSCGIDQTHKSFKSQRVVLDSNGNMFTTYPISDLFKKDSSGNDKWSLSFPSEIIQDTIFLNDGLYVLTSLAGTSGGGVSKVDINTGKVITKWTKNGGSFFFQSTKIVQAPGTNRVYIAEQGSKGNSTVSLIELDSTKAPDAKNLSKITLTAGEIIGGLAVDAAGDLYIASNTKNTITKYNNGSPVWVKGGLPVGTGQGQFNNISYITFGPDGNLYVADAGNKRIQILDTNGNFFSQLKDANTLGNDLTGITSISFDNNGYMYIAGKNGTKKYGKPCGTFKVIKKIIPESTDKFDFNTNIGHSFSLKNGEEYTFSTMQNVVINPRTGEVSNSVTSFWEELVDGYNTKVSCVPSTPTSGTLIVKNTNLVIAHLKDNELITCTFINTKKGYTPAPDTADRYDLPTIP